MKIYIASKAYHRPLWRQFRDMKAVPINSRWIDVDDKHIGTTYGDPDCLNYAELWKMCVEDVVNCDVLVVAVESANLLGGDAEVLKGALVEVGVALAHNKRVIAVGSSDHFLQNGTWLMHPNVEHSSKSIYEVLMGLKDEQKA